MAGCGWEPVAAFRSLDDYQQLVSSIESQVATGTARRVPVDQSKGWGSAWHERWYECQEDQRIWRLVAPDPPFPGVFKLL